MSLMAWASLMDMTLAALNLESPRGPSESDAHDIIERRALAVAHTLGKGCRSLKKELTSSSFSSGLSWEDICTKHRITQLQWMGLCSDP